MAESILRSISMFAAVDACRYVHMYLEFVFATWPIFYYTRRQFITLYTVLSYVCTYIGINFLQNIFFTEASGQPATTPLQWHQVFHSKYKLSYLVVCVTT
jgi:hypothetical protein